MNKIVKCEWIGPKREVPGYGIFELGDTCYLPLGVADGLARQGLLALTKKSIKPSKKKK
jgi:hypothetical protein